jgi:hypothetical protein
MKRQTNTLFDFWKKPRLENLTDDTNAAATEKDSTVISTLITPQDMSSVSSSAGSSINTAINVEASESIPLLSLPTFSSCMVDSAIDVQLVPINDCCHWPEIWNVKQKMEFSQKYHWLISNNKKLGEYTYLSQCMICG